MVLTKVFAQFNMEIQKAVLDTQQETASNIFYMRPNDVHYIMENQEQFLRKLKQALHQLINSKTILFDAPNLVMQKKHTLVS